MSARGPYRRRSPQFKVQLCTDIRMASWGGGEAQKAYQISANLIQLWLTQYDRGELDTEEAAAATIAEYEAKIAVLERKVGQLTMELDLVKNHRACRSSAAASHPRLSAARHHLDPAGLPSDPIAA